MRDSPIDGIVVLTLSLLIAICCCGLGASITAKHFKKEAVKRGFAVYDAKTGQWEWKEPPQ